MTFYKKLFMTNQYKTNWEDYWSRLFEDGDTALWDVPSDLAVADTLLRLKRSFDSTLPLIDFGCGNGTQTFFLAEYFSTIIGVDVAKSAIKQAQANNSFPNLSFEVLDGMDEAEVQAFSSKIGDANIYMRGILHQISAKDRPTIIKSLQTLMGKKGGLYLSELSPKAKTLFEDLARETGTLPPQLARVYQHGIEPAEISPEEIRNSFLNNKYAIAEAGEISIVTNHILPNGDRLQVPAFYMLIKPI